MTTSPYVYVGPLELLEHVKREGPGACISTRDELRRWLQGVRRRVLTYVVDEGGRLVVLRAPITLHTRARGSGP